MKGGDDMKKITFAALLILAGFAVCAWSAKGSEGTRKPAEAGAPDPAPTAEVVEPPQVSPEPVEPAWAEYEATAYCSCEKCCGAWAENRPDDGSRTNMTAATFPVPCCCQWAPLMKLPPPR